ncbi:hypothetical protein CYMTET_24361 [Cymbomonas tetramitiformis]|uniref:THO complex subunit 3 n=1 Tax=Cymbomonas tetramitiformis TaxID=36881 RepID=A0AAE0FWG2_9CHLO|nr:hypothetical protein CYMTET_24361 [Cymbomonas tetramitiformis]
MAKDNLFKGLNTKDYFGHKKKVHSVAWNCIGTKLASGSVDQTARIWSIDSTTGKGKDELELKGHTDSVDQLCWDPNNAERLATASGDRTVRIWDTRSGKCASTVQTQGENINISWSPDGSSIAVGNRDDVITFIDTRTFKILRTSRFLFEVNEIAWDKSGEEFFLTTGLGTIEVMTYPELKTVRSLQAHTAGVYCIAFDPTGNRFAAGSADALVSVWDLKHKVCVNTLPRLDWPIRTLSFSHDGKYIASGSEDLLIDIADAATGECAHQIQCTAAMNSIAWNPCHNLLAFAGDDRAQDDRGGSYGREGRLRVFGFPSH